MEDSQRYWLDPITALLEISADRYKIAPSNTTIKRSQCSELAGYSQYPPEIQLLSDEDLQSLRAAVQSIKYRVKLYCERGIVLIVPIYRGNAATIRLRMDEYKRTWWLPKDYFERGIKLKPLELYEPSNSPSRKADRLRISASRTAAEALRDLMLSITTEIDHLPITDPFIKSHLLELHEETQKLPESITTRLGFGNLCSQRDETIKYEKCTPSLCSECTSTPLPSLSCVNQRDRCCVCWESTEEQEERGACGHWYCEKCLQRNELLRYCIACVVQSIGNCGECEATETPLLKQCKGVYLCLDCTVRRYTQTRICNKCGEDCSDDLLFLITKYKLYVSAGKALLCDVDYLMKTDEKGLFLCKNCHEILSPFNYDRSAKFGTVVCPLCDQENIY